MTRPFAAVLILWLCAALTGIAWSGKQNERDGARIAPTPLAAYTRCQGKTRKKERCRRVFKAIAGQSLCWQHRAE